MSKTNTTKSKFTKRVGIPKIVKDKAGNALLLCPFCVPTHTLQPNIPSRCGTSLILTAEQVIIRAKYDKYFICVKCGKGGGDMVQYQDGVIHLEDCKPNTLTMLEPPPTSKFARFVHGMKNKRLKKFVEAIKGQAIPLEEVDPVGVKTGVVKYFFLKKEMTNGKHIETSPGN